MRRRARGTRARALEAKVALAAIIVKHEGKTSELAGRPQRHFLADRRTGKAKHRLKGPAAFRDNREFRRPKVS